MRWLGFEANIPAWSASALLQSGTYMVASNPGSLFWINPGSPFRILSRSFFSKAARQNPEQRAWVWGYLHSTSNPFPHFLPMIHTMIALCASKNAELLWTAWVLVPIVYTLAIWDTRLFTCACATTWILAVASIRERRLFHSARPEVRRQFKSAD